MSNLRHELATIIARITARGWCPATAGNFSVRLPGEPLRMLISPTGVDKSLIKANDLLEITRDGKVLQGRGEPSAEYLLHLALYEELGANAVLHVHTIWNTVLSKEFLADGAIRISGFEILKGLEKINTHEHTEVIPVLENSQNMAALAQKLRAVLKQNPNIHGFLLAGHGSYTYGDSILSAYRHLEALEFLLEVQARAGARISLENKRRLKMAKVRIPKEQLEYTEFEAVKYFLSTIGIGYERWDTSRDLSDTVPAAQILDTYASEIETLKASGGYQTADVIDVKPDTPNLQTMLDKFNREHWHDEDEVRFIIEGHGIFHINPKTSPVVAIEVGKGDLLRVPAGTLHWFDLCGDKRIRAIRLFQDPSGWTPRYSESGVDKGYMPLCFGLSYIPSQLQGL